MQDNAFQFKTDTAGQEVKLQGFAVAKYIDLCSSEKQQEEGVKEGVSCAKPDTLKSDNEKQLESVTFFATTVKYL